MYEKEKKKENARSKAIDYTYTLYSISTLYNADFHLFVHLINANALHFILWFTVLWFRAKVSVHYCCCCLLKFWINKRTYVAIAYILYTFAMAYCQKIERMSKQLVCFGWFVFCLWIKRLVYAFISVRVLLCMWWNGVWEFHEHLFVCGCMRRCANRVHE